MFDIDTDPEYTDVKSLVEMNPSEQAAWPGCRWKLDTGISGAIWMDGAVSVDLVVRLVVSQVLQPPILACLIRYSISGELQPRYFR